MKAFIFLLFPFFALSQSTYYPTDTLIDLYRVDTTIDTVPVIITYIDYDYALNIVKYLIGYEVIVTIKDNYPISLTMLAGNNYVNSSNRYTQSGYPNIKFKTLKYLDIDKRNLPDNYKVLQTYKQ